MAENVENSIVVQENVQLASGSSSIFSDANKWRLSVRMAEALAQSTIVPKEYQGNVANCIIAIEMSSRLNTSPMQVMQNLYVVNGRPAWSSQYIIAVINSSGKYKHELKFEISGSGESLSCYAWTTDKTGEKIIGPIINMKMANAEGWVNKSGSKWKTMPEVMIRYRAASFFGRLYCSDMIMGIYSKDEVYDLVDVDDSDYVIPEVKAEAEIEKNANKEIIDAGSIIENDTPESENGAPLFENNPPVPPTPPAQQPKQAAPF